MRVAVLAPRAGQSGRFASALPPRVEPRDHHAPPNLAASARTWRLWVPCRPAAAPAGGPGLALSRRHGHAAARGTRPVVPVVLTVFGSRTLRTRGECQS